MPNSAQLIDDLQHQPDFPEAVEELQKRLEQEKAKRTIPATYGFSLLKTIKSALYCHRTFRF